MLDPQSVFEMTVRAQAQRVFLLEHLIPDEPGYSLLCGRPGIGKSILALNLCCALDTGTPFLGRSTIKSPVGYWTAEGSKRALYDRLSIIKKRYPPTDDSLHLGVMSFPRLPGKESEFEARLWGLKLVVIDPVKFAIRGDYTRPMDALAFIDSLLKVSRRIGCSFLLVHHVRKSNPMSMIEPGDLDEVKGGTDYADQATSVLLLERQRQGHTPAGGFAPVNPDDRQLYFAKARDSVVELPPLQLRFLRPRLEFEVK